ncbi:MAG: FAD-dependent oxidoreductase [Clostridiales Family XIII bacterium]|jgi:electron transfer flavoprotein-quinone oxidoreductase|nr:FAD-dependent oxidoreductase [Clostridiales Family XIII bacterium]
MSEEKFDAIIVGGGLAGSAAAYTLAKAGLEVAVIERGTSCGSKNVTGGRIYAHSLAKLIPDYAETAPLERKIVKERIVLMGGTGSTTIEYGDEGLKEPAYASYSVLRAKLDAWLAEKAEEAGALYITGIRVDELLQENGKVTGVVADGDSLNADVVLLADGVHSLLAQQIGLKKDLTPHQVGVGVKEVIGLDEKTISDRFGVLPGEGVACLIAGHATGGAVGGGILYTNKNSISLGTVVSIGHIGDGEGLKVPDMVERLKESPLIAPLIAGGELLEYSAHLVPEGGISMTPQLVGDGVLIAGDAAGFVMNLGFTFRGMDLAIESGRLAGEAIIKAKEKSDFSSSGLSEYRSLLDNSFIMRDLKHFRKMPDFMESSQIYKEIPEIAGEVFGSLFKIDGSAPKKMLKNVNSILKRNIKLTTLIKLATKAMGAM